ncbi:GNAT family N-acetyltransferase [Candidatus Frankia nodulisporulans]|uniref:GNAT family N-acetyltransferase n=1 Tax=Candidatus Frankia nodulisporulans TaxID=2060052 RepID=UPI0013D55E7E|nr:GNAT family N-acetyltransferase [Candidatus Frankia nodulisporulans]
MSHPLDNPVRAALLGPQAHLAEGHGAVLRFPPDVCPFLGLPDEPDLAAWHEAAHLLGPGALILYTLDATPPPGWEVNGIGTGVQMIDVSMRAAPDPEAVRLTAADVPEMLDLVARAKPGPFLPRTIEMGTYLGIRHGGTLVAMAGERMHPPGWTEISAVCTDPAQRGQGLAGRLVRAVAAGIRARGERPFLHTLADNTNAIRLYERLGFEIRRTVAFRAVRIPVSAPAPRPSEADEPVA